MVGSPLRSARDFARVFHTGRRARRDGVTVYVVAAELGRGPSRLGLAVRAGRAVDRNLVKRRLRRAWAAFGPGDGYEVAVRAEAHAVGISYQELERHLHRALAAAGLPGDVG